MSKVSGTCTCTFKWTHVTRGKKCLPIEVNHGYEELHTSDKMESTQLC